MPPYGGEAEVSVKITKEVLGYLDSCYACAGIEIDGKGKFLVASEERQSCLMIDEETGVISTVWKDIGGTMSIVPLPGRNGEFLASQNFYPGFNAKESTIVWAAFRDEKWEVKTLFKLPYIHRFDILESDNGRKYFIGCTLCEYKKSLDDWSSGGHILVCDMPEDLIQPFNLKSIKRGLIRNHGYYKKRINGLDIGVVTCDSGAYMVKPPNRCDKDWNINQLIDWPVSDLAFVDIDNDGNEELITIESFHGNSFNIYKKRNKVYEKVYCYSGEMEFGHIVWGGRLAGVPTAVGGYRALSKELFYVQYVNGEYKTVTIDEGGGPCNMFAVCHEDKDVLVVTNGALNQITKYVVTK